MRISVFTWEEQERKKKIFISFFNLVLDQLQVYSDLTYFRNFRRHRSYLAENRDLLGVGTSSTFVFFRAQALFMAFNIQTASILFIS